METISENKSGASVRAWSLLVGTQLAILIGSLLIALFWFAVFADSQDYLGAITFAGLVFIAFLISSFIIVNIFVLVFAVPTYFLCKPPAGYATGAFIGAVSAIVAFCLLLVAIDPSYFTRLISRNMDFIRGGFWNLPFGAWLFVFVPALYGALVGLFTSELESRRSHIV